MATHSSILAWRSPWTDEPGGLQSIGSQSRAQLKQLSHTYVPIYCKISKTAWGRKSHLFPGLIVTVFLIIVNITVGWCSLDRVWNATVQSLSHRRAQRLILLQKDGEGNGNPLQYSCLENPLCRGAWWAAVHGVAQSQSRLKRLSMHACIGEGNGNALQCSCLENPRDRGARWAAVYGVAQSWTRLKRLSSSMTLIAI